MVLRLLLLLTFFTANGFTMAFAGTSENTQVYTVEPVDSDTYNHYRTFFNLPELGTESVPNSSVRLNPEEYYGVDLAKVALTNLKSNEDRIHDLKLKDGARVDLKLPSHFICFQFHSFP